MAEVKHPIFARIYNSAIADWEAKGQGDHRRELLEGLSGRVVEIGPGNGVNFKYYGPGVTEVVAVEPEPHMRGLAEQATAEVSVPIRVMDGMAEQLPLEDGSMDAGVACLMLCSVADLDAVLAELRRVIRPAGELRFYEHVAAHNPRLRRIQDVIEPAWKRFAGGCHTNRDTVGAIERAGFALEHGRHFQFRPDLTSAPVAPHVIGVARRV